MVDLGKFGYMGILGDRPEEAHYYPPSDIDAELARMQQEQAEASDSTKVALAAIHHALRPDVQAKAKANMWLTWGLVSFMGWVGVRYGIAHLLAALAIGCCLASLWYCVKYLILRGVAFFSEP